MTTPKYIFVPEFGPRPSYESWPTLEEIYEMAFDVLDGDPPRPLASLAPPEGLGFADRSAAFYLGWQCVPQPRVWDGRFVSEMEYTWRTQDSEIPLPSRGLARACCSRHEP